MKLVRDFILLGILTGVVWWLFGMKVALIMLIVILALLIIGLLLFNPKYGSNIDDDTHR